MAKKRLGIDALFQSSVPAAVPADAESQTVTDRELDLELIVPNPHQPRVYYDETSLEDLARSIRTHGVLQPLIVRKVAGDSPYQIVAGERRWRASRMAGLKRVPVRIVDLSDDEALAVAMVENLQREDLNPIEEAEGYLDLLKTRLVCEAAFQTFCDDVDTDMGVIRVLRALNNRAAGNTKDNVVLSLESAVSDVFGRVGRITWQSFVAHRLPLLNMPDEIKTALRTGQLPHTKARVIARVTAASAGGDELKARDLRRELVHQAVAKGLSVRGLQAEVARIATGPRFGESAPTVVDTTDGIERLEEQCRELGRRLESAALDSLTVTEVKTVAAAVSKLLKIL